MEFYRIEEKIPFYVGQKVKIRENYDFSIYEGKITRIDTFKPLNEGTEYFENICYNLHIKYIRDIAPNGKIYYSEAVVYPQTNSRMYNHYHSLIGVIDEN